MQTLFTSDRMIVKWQTYNALHIHNDKTQWQIPYIFLDFIFQVNGKQTEYTINIELENDEPKLWYGWNSICELFHDMGYKFQEWLEPNYWIIRGWIDKCLHNDWGIPWRVIDISTNS